MSAPMDLSASLGLLLKTLKLPGFAAHYEEVAVTAERQGWSFGQYLHQLAEIELEERRQRRLVRNLRASQRRYRSKRKYLALRRRPVTPAPTRPS